MYPFLHFNLYPFVHQLRIFILPAGPDFVFPVNAKKKKEMKIESEKKVHVSFCNLAEKKILLRRLA